LGKELLAIPVGLDEGLVSGRFVSKRTRSRKADSSSPRSAQPSRRGGAGSEAGMSRVGRPHRVGRETVFTSVTIKILCALVVRPSLDERRQGSARPPRRPLIRASCGRPLGEIAVDLARRTRAQPRSAARSFAEGVLVRIERYRRAGRIRLGLGREGFRRNVSNRTSRVCELPLHWAGVGHRMGHEVLGRGGQQSSRSSRDVAGSGPARPRVLRPVRRTCCDRSSARAMRPEVGSDCVGFMEALPKDVFA